MRHFLKEWLLTKNPGLLIVSSLRDIKKESHSEKARINELATWEN